MKIYDIILQLQKEIPKHTSLFSTQVPVATMTYNAGTVTVTSSSNHNIKNGDLIVVKGAKSPNIISTLAQADGVATATTTDNHDLTELWPDGSDTLVDISNALDSEYNGNKKLLSVIARNKFQFEVDKTSPASTTGAQLNEDKNYGYNGAFNATVVNDTSFTYTIPKSVGTPAVGDIDVQRKIRISGGISIDKIIESYTKQNVNELWAFVIMDDTVTSKQRSINNDADAMRAPGSDPRQCLIQNFSVYVFVPAKNEIAARNGRDLMEDVMLALFKSLLGYKPPTVLCEGAFNGITFVSHSTFAYNESYFIQRFQFQNLVDLTLGDTLKEDIDVAFRDIHIDYIDPVISDGDDIIMTSDINLDEELS